MRVVIVGHAASPDRGSEPGITWNWAWYLSRHHDVWLVNYPEFQSEVEAYLAVHQRERLRVVWAQNNPSVDPWRPGRRTTGASFKVHYLLWLAHVQKIVAKLVSAEGIDVVHQVGLMTISAPSRLWKLPVPFIWGPVGGGETAPTAFRHYYGNGWRREQLRRLRIYLVGRSAALRRTVKGACYVFAINRETLAVLVKAGAECTQLKLLADCGVRPEALRREVRTGPKDGYLTLLWAGRLDARKALPILLDAMADLEHRTESTIDRPLSLRLLVAGEGPKRAEWERHAELCGVAHRVTFLGGVAPTHMAEVFKQADAFVFTSLQDAMGTVVIEALTHGLPVIVLNHQGCASVVPDDAAIKIAVTNPAETVSALAKAIDSFRLCPDQLSPLSERALAAAQQLDWPSRADAMVKVYEHAKNTVRWPKRDEVKSS